jgi:hypothetical protein
MKCLVRDILKRKIKNISGVHFFLAQIIIWINKKFSLYLLLTTLFLYLVARIILNLFNLNACIIFYVSY